MSVSKEENGDGSEAGREAHGSDQKELLAAELIDDRHGEQGGDKIGGADRYGLEIAGDFACAGKGEDVVEVIEDGIDAGELSEHADGEGENNRLAGLAGEKRIGLPGALQMHGGDDLIELLLGFGDPGEAKNLERLLQIGLRDQPARAARNDEEHGQKEHSRNSGDAEHPAPFVRPEVHAADDRVRDVGEKNADNDIDLKGSHQPAAPGGRRNLRDIHLAEKQLTTDAASADEIENAFP